jgi:hypothetical protein
MLERSGSAFPAYDGASGRAARSLFRHAIDKAPLSSAKRARTSIGQRK